MKKFYLYVLLVTVGFVFAQNALAVDYTVSKFTDTADGTCNADCSLREAITAANANIDEAHTIILGAGTYELSIVNATGDEDLNVTGDLDITNTSYSISIQGNTAGTTIIDANGAVTSDRAFEVITDAQLVIDDVTIQGGDTAEDGGGIYANMNGDIYMSDCIVKNNSGNNGGGLYIRNASWPDNYIKNTAILNNTSVGNGGGLYLNALSSDNSIYNLTIASNTAANGGGIYFYQGTGYLSYFLTITNNSASSDGGGVASYDDTGSNSIYYSIVANNTVSSSLDDCDDNSYNAQDSIFEDSSCTATDAAATGVDPGLESDISDDGDSTTFAFTDPSTSAAVNKVSSFSVLTDQRGETRTGYADYGAYEYQDSVLPVITITNNTSVYNTVECNGTYSDQGATATDDIDGTLTASITTTGVSSVDESTLGSYSVTYDVDDLSTNSATTATRTVTVSDTTDPVVTLTGESTVSVNQGGTYTESGATAADGCEGTLSVTTTGTVDTDTAGSYTVTYTATDSTGNTGISTRAISVVDPGADDDSGEGPDGSEDVDPNNPNEVSAAISSVAGFKKGKIKVNYADGTDYNYTVFNGDKTTKKTKVKQYRNTGYYIVVQGLGKKVALVNALNGEVLKRKKINTKKKYQTNSLKVLKLRKKYWAVVTSKNAKNKVRLALVRIQINKTSFGKKVTATTTSSKIKTTKTKKAKNYLKLNNKKGKLIKKYLFTKKYKLNSL